MDQLKSCFLRACERGNVSKIEEYLSESDLSDLIDDNFWDKCLDHACEFGQTKVVHLLLSKAIFHFDDYDDWALGAASENGHLDIMQLMINQGATDLDRALWLACLAEEYNSVLFLLQKGAVLDYEALDYGEDAEDREENKRDLWFVEQEEIQLQLLSDGIPRSQLSNIPNVTTLFEKLDQVNDLYEKEILAVLPLRNLFSVCAGYICLENSLIQRAILPSDEIKMNDEQKLKSDFLFACERGKISSMEKLLSKSNLRDFMCNNFWDNCLNYASKHGQIKVVHLILVEGHYGERYSEYCDYMEDYQHEHYNSALAEASQNGHLDIMQLLIDRGAKNLNLALWEACSFAQYNSVAFLLQKGAVWDYDVLAYFDMQDYDLWFVEQENIQLKLLSDGIPRSHLDIIPNITSLFTKLDQANDLYKLEIFNVMPVCDLVFVCAQYICL